MTAEPVAELDELPSSRELLAKLVDIMAENTRLLGEHTAYLQRLDARLEWAEELMKKRMPIGMGLKLGGKR